MGYARIIRVRFENIEGTTIYCDLCDTSVDLPDPEVFVVSATEDPVIRTVEEDGKYKGIKSTSLTIKFHSNSTIDLNDFLEVDDGYWYVNCYHTSDIAANCIFKGFVILAGIEQPFMPNPSVIQVTATDNLGVLKDRPLSTKGGTFMMSEWTLGQYLAYALYQTGIETNINVINNIMEEDTPTEPFYETASLNAKTFEKEVREAEDCYTVIEKIIGEDSRVFQYNGEWWIVRLDEYSSNGMYRHIFSNNGVLTSSEAIDTWNKTIGKDEAIKFVLEDAVVTSERPLNKSTISFDYENPIEIVDNIDFSQGDFNGVISVPAGSSAFDFAWWTHLKGGYAGQASGTPNGLAYIRRDYNTLGYEIERYLVLGTFTGFNELLKSSDIPVSDKDKFNISIDFRWDSDYSSGGSTYPSMDYICARLIGDGGGTYDLLNTGKWASVTSTAYPQGFFYQWDANLQDETEWQTISIESDPLPDSGTVNIFLKVHPNSGAFSGKTLHLQNLRIEYLPLINGSYRKYKGQHNRITQADGMYKASREADIKVCEAPRKLMKGALMKYNGSKYVLIDGVYNGAVYPGGLPSAANIHPYSYMQAFAVWNQYNRAMRIFRGTALGLGTDIPSLIHVFELTATTDHTTNKDYILLGFEQDLRSCRWALTLGEVYDSVTGRVYSDDHEFKYITA